LLCLCLEGARGRPRVVCIYDAVGGSWLGGMAVTEQATTDKPCACAGHSCWRTSTRVRLPPSRVRAAVESEGRSRQAGARERKGKPRGERAPAGGSLCVFMKQTVAASGAWPLARSNGAATRNQSNLSPHSAMGRALGPEFSYYFILMNELRTSWNFNVL
jgi:hypothetical protein